MDSKALLAVLVALENSNGNKNDSNCDPCVSTRDLTHLMAINNQTLRVQVQPFPDLSSAGIFY